MLPVHQNAQESSVMQRHEPVLMAMQQHGGRAKDVDVVEDGEPPRVGALPRPQAELPREVGRVIAKRVN